MSICTFISYLKYEKRSSDHTIVAYKNDLKQFCEFIDYKSEDDLLQVTKNDVRRWVISLIEQGVLKSSVNRKISTLKSFFLFLVKNRKLDHNPAKSIILPKIPKRQPVFIEEEQMRILTQINFSDDFTGTRDRLILELFYSTGIRLSELVDLKERCVDEQSMTVKVLGKRKKERLIPISKEILEYVKRYLALRNELFEGLICNAFFLTDKGEPVYPKLIYRLVIKYLSKVTTLTKKSPHVLRHTFATHMLNRGADINIIKEILGHSSLAATQIYTHNSFERLKSVYKQAHPRAK